LQECFEIRAVGKNGAFEKHYRIGELARLWGLGRETVRKLVARNSLKENWRREWERKPQARFTRTCCRLIASCILHSGSYTEGPDDEPVVI
jgi:hypothetical protein